MDRIVLRTQQQRLVDTTLNRLSMSQRSAVAYVHPGLGKTIGGLAVAVELFRRNLIDAVQVFVPRINLGDQWETDWQQIRPLYDTPSMGSIARRENDPPLLRGADACGYITTYAALAAARDSVVGNIHVDFARGRRVLVIADEAQILGVDESGGGTRAAEVFTDIAGAAACTLLLTGTPYRADNRPLLLARYGEPDAQGRRQLLADVEAGYREGVALGYLRPFEATLIDGFGLQQLSDGAQERLIVSETDSGLRRVLMHPGFWSPLVDRTVEQVQAIKAIDRRLCGLVAACTQQHAQDIQRYVMQRYPNMRTLIAVSDDRAAQANLRAFRAGGYDLLISVQMAYVGYDHKPISVVCVLSDVRHPGFVRQLLARGMRMMPDLPMDQQMLFGIVPDDPAMAAIVRDLRDESDQGLRERNDANGERPPEGQVRILIDAGATTERAEGLQPEGDLSADECAIIERAQRAWGLGASSRTALASLLRANGIEIAQLRIPEAPRPSTSASTAPVETQRDAEMRVRRELQTLARTCDGLMQRVDPSWSWGDTAAECKRVHGGIGNDQCGVDELELRLRWMRTIWQAKVLALVQTRDRAS